MVNRFLLPAASQVDRIGNSGTERKQTPSESGSGATPGQGLKARCAPNGLDPLPLRRGGGPAMTKPLVWALSARQA